MERAAPLPASPRGLAYTKANTKASRFRCISKYSTKSAKLISIRRIFDFLYFKLILDKCWAVIAHFALRFADSLALPKITVINSVGLRKRFGMEILLLS